MFLTTVGSGHEVDLNPGDSHLLVGGEFNEWLNITQRSLISDSDYVQDNGIYMCEVCTDRDTLSEECHTSNVTLHIIGGQPFIDKAMNNSMFIIHLHVQSCI